MNIDITLSTRNRSKSEQIKAALSDLRANILSLDEAGIKGNVVEDGRTLEENAWKKADFAWSKTKGWIIAEDTGLFIDALGGEPGIHAARWAGENLTTEEIMNFTLAKLTGVPPHLRTARFVTVAVVINPKRIGRVFVGSVEGSFLSKPRTTCQPNMPYSAIFLPHGQEKVFAEMTVEYENTISHRGQAFRRVRDYLAKAIS